MKKIKILLFNLLLIYAYTSNSQCLNIDGDMESFVVTSPSGYSSVRNLTNWFNSHGSPKIIAAGGSIASAITNNIVMVTGKSHQSQGVYTKFNFVNGKTYTLKYDIWRNGNPTAKFNINLANGIPLLPYPIGNTVATPPTISSKQQIAADLWSNIGAWITVTKTFVANNNYSQLWFYPSVNSIDTTGASCLIDNVCVLECTSPIARSEFRCARGTIIKPSKYGPKEVTELCLLDDLFVDGSATSCENKYFIHLSEFDLNSWGNVTILHQGWVNGIAPNNIKITDYLPLGYQLRPGKIYKFSLGVGYPWNATEMYFTIVCCDDQCIDEISHNNDSGGILDNGGGVSNAGKATISIHPNPTKDQVIFDFNNFKNNSTIKLQIFDETGIEMYSSETAKTSYTIDIQSWKSGIYNCKIVQNDTIIFKKLIKK